MNPQTIIDVLISQRNAIADDLAIERAKNIELQQNLLGVEKAKSELEQKLSSIEVAKVDLERKLASVLTAADGVCGREDSESLEGGGGEVDFVTDDQDKFYG